MVQAMGGLAILAGLFLTAKTLRTTQEGQITDRFTKAINQLGEAGPEKLAIRLGGIYALERIARDSERDHWPIMEILTAYVRENAPWKEEQSSREVIPPKLATDIQAILTVLGRRTLIYGKGEAYCLNLTGTDLRGADLLKAHLEGAILTETHLEGAALRGAHLEKANLLVAYLNKAGLVGAHIEGGFLGGTHLEEATLMGTHLEGTQLVHASLDGADLRGAHLEGARGLTIEQLSKVSTLYQVHLDPPLQEQIRQEYPHLLEMPNAYMWLPWV